MATNKVRSSVAATVDSVVDHLPTDTAVTLEPGDTVRTGVGRVHRFLGPTAIAGADLGGQDFTSPVWQLVSRLVAGGSLAVIARNSAGIFANTKVVSSSVTTTDGGSGSVLGAAREGAAGRGPRDRRRPGRHDHRGAVP